MHTDTDHLKTLAIEIAERQNPELINESKADHRLLYETNKLEKGITQALRSIDNFTQRDTLHNDVLGKLVEICDVLYVPNRRVTPDAQAVLDLIRDIRKIIPGITSPLLDLPKAFIHEQREILKDQWQVFEDVLYKYEIDTELITISAIPFIRFIEAKDKLYWGDFTWLKGYIARLHAADWEHADCNSKTEALMSLLIGRDFNHEQFYVYCKKYIAARVAKVSGKRNRILAYAHCEKLVLEDTQIGAPSFDIHANPVGARLIKLIREEMEFVRTYEPDLPFAKLNFRFFKYTLAFFFKLLHEQKVFGDITFRELTEQIESTCTAMGADVPAASIRKKAYPYKQVDFKQMEALLLAMLEYLRRFMR